MNSALSHGIYDALLDEDLRDTLEQYPELCAILEKLDTKEQPFRAKRSYDVTTQSVAISTIHSVKGFDYSCVFVINLNCGSMDRDGRKAAKSNIITMDD